MLDAAAAKACAPGALVAAITEVSMRGGPIQTSLVDHVAINVLTSTPPGWPPGGGLPRLR